MKIINSQSKSRILKLMKRFSRQKILEPRQRYKYEIKIRIIFLTNVKIQALNSKSTLKYQIKNFEAQT